MRFDDPREPAPYLNRQDQRRLLGMVAVLSFVVIAVIWAARPASWHWLIPPDNETALNEADPESDLDSAPRFESDQAPPASNPFSAPETPLKQNDSRPVANTTGSPVEIPEDWLEDVNDQYIGLRADESDSYYRVLAHVTRLDEDLLSRSARSDVLHVNLMHEPERYRGELVQLKGTARRIVPLDATENQYGIRKLYEIWITTDDSGSEPWRIVAKSIDERLPVGENVNAPIKAIGYFFKQYSYASQGGMHIAPLILSARVDSNVVVRVAPSGTGLQPYIILFAAFFGLGTILLVSAYSHGDRLFQTRMKEQFPPVDDEAQKVLKKMEGQRYDPTDVLNDLPDDQVKDNAIFLQSPSGGEGSSSSG
ncbi:hypothetical protein [Rubinisphaera margarita]|uniref:hypothetical protein n=1 Tax=Rubinisphaera margarita TaxID=2909586 RepID=UPI001EE88421|nr:hypothetical protein [Rubinisphaera margarita]MCG6155862.1 hypothetical protein [Rubinisphaera margarita]